MIQSLLFGFGYKMRSGKDEAVKEIIRRRSGNGPGWYDIRKYSFAQELKREVTKNALASGGMKHMFSDGLRIDGAGFMQENGNILALPDWVQYDPDAPLDDVDCPLGKQRSLLQFWGQEYRRSVNPTYWIDKLSKRIEDEKPEIALVSDLRYLNEFAWVREYGDCVRVDRPGLPQGTHSSETELSTLPDSSWDGILTNDGTLEELQDAAVLIFDKLLDQINDGTL